MQQENEQKAETTAVPQGLSDAWQQLLGNASFDAETLAALRDSIPTLASDPWSALLHAKGVEIVDLEQVHLHVSDQDMEQILQIMQDMQEQPGISQAGQTGLSTNG